MTEPQYNLFLSAAAWVCAVGALFNLLRLKARGTSALLLSAAFLVMGSILWLIKSHASQPLITAAAVLLAVLLIGDFVQRSRNREDQP